MTHQTWEYHIEHVDGDIKASVPRLNELGAAGWELVTIQHDRAIFKRLGFNYRERATLAQKARLVAVREEPSDEA